MAAIGITGGAFQDGEGVPLANGTAYFKLSADATDTATGTQQICAGYVIEYELDSSGNVPSGATLWPNDLLTGNVSQTNNTFYWIEARDASGQRVYGPNAFTILSTSNPFPLNTLVPSNPS